MLDNAMYMPVFLLHCPIHVGTLGLRLVPRTRAAARLQISYRQCRYDLRLLVVTQDPALSYQSLLEISSLFFLAFRSRCVSVYITGLTRGTVCYSTGKSPYYHAVKGTVRI